MSHIDLDLRPFVTEANYHFFTSICVLFTLIFQKSIKMYPQIYKHVELV